MTRLIEEVVLPYHRRDRDAWNRGDRSLVPSFVDPVVFVKGLPSRHFGEMFVLRHFHRTRGLGGRFLLRHR